jgi:pimeloyl-ACP methyl ester carboxylesterase
MQLFLVSFSQEITGQWNGVLKVQGMQLKIVFNISKGAAGYSATMDSPDQGAKGIPVSNTSFVNPNLKLEVANLRVEYTGVLKDRVISGTFRQNGAEFPMDLTRDQIEKQTVKRAQEPNKPFPYDTEEVTFQNFKANITLAGTLSIPKNGNGKFPAVVLITGSGPQNRDEELMGHKPFLVLSDHLTKRGIAVLRYDDRGVGQSKGDFKTATTADFATDAESAFAYLKGRKEIDAKKIGLVGHSEGGLIAPMVAARLKEVGFIVLLAGTGIRGDKLLLMQQELIAKASGSPAGDIEKNRTINSRAFEMVIKSTSDETLKADLKNYITETIKKNPGDTPKGMTEDQFVALQMKQTTNPWMLYFIRYDPAPTLEKVKCPVLAVNGSKDLQVPPGENLQAIEKALKKGGNKQVTTIEFPGLNHLFQECKTGLPKEYAEIEQTFSPSAMNEIALWITKQTK